MSCTHAFAASHVLAQCPSAKVGLPNLLEQEQVALVFLGTAGPVERLRAAERVTFAVQLVWKGPARQATTIYRPSRPDGNTGTREAGASQWAVVGF